jgi:hypothetical protein
MGVSRRSFCITAGAIGALRGSGSAAMPRDLSMQARLRLGKLARRSLPEGLISDLLASRAAGLEPAECCTLAALVREDFRAGRTVDLGGVRFARAEVATFLAAGRASG